MSLVSIAVATTSLDVAATAAAAGQYQATIRAADGTTIATANADGPSFSFPGVPAGEHSVTVARLDVNGGVIGTPITAPVSVPVVAPTPAPVVTVDVPSGVTVTVTAE